MPSSPLSGLVRRINTPRLSPFQTNSDPCCSYKSCVLAIYNPAQPNNLLASGEEAIFFSYLAQNGYVVDTALTKIMKQAPVKPESRLLCMISK